MNNMITDDLLLENGYKEWEVPAINKYAKKFFQKKFMNGNGQTEYFISFYKYVHKDDTVNYEVELQFTKDRYTMNITMFAIDVSMTIHSIEAEVYDIWYNLDCKCYCEG